jgi:5-methylcytosine-specific restriction endonuclease McrA
MTWFKIDDGFYDHPKTFDASDAAIALWVRAGTWSSRNLTDGFVPAGMPPRLSAEHDAAVKELCVRGLWKRARGGFQFHDWHEYNRTAEEVKSERKANTRRQALFRDPALRQTVRERDNDTCRYCGVRVQWNDRRGVRGGTYDHVDPSGPNIAANLVVCCRACDSRKGSRTPEQAGLLLSSPDANQNITSYNQVSHSTPTRPDPTRPKEEDSLRSSSSVPRNRGIRIPDDFTVDAAMRQWAATKTPGVNVDTETENFVDYWKAKPGQGGVKLDWVATWRTWIRRASDRAGPHLRAVPGGYLPFTNPTDPKAYEEGL